jgi:hypothetical protein
VSVAVGGAPDRIRGSQLLLIVSTLPARTGGRPEGIAHQGGGPTGRGPEESRDGTRTITERGAGCEKAGDQRGRDRPGAPPSPARVTEPPVPAERWSTGAGRRPPRVVLTPRMRGLLTVLNAVVRHGKPWTSTPDRAPTRRSALALDRSTRLLRTGRLTPNGTRRPTTAARAGRPERRRSARRPARWRAARPPPGMIGRS